MTGEERKLDQERDADDMTAALLDESQGRCHRPAGREQIVDGQHTLAGPDGVFVHRQSVATVLELVFHLDRFPGQLAKLAHGDESRTELMRQCPGEDESTRLDADDDLDPLLLVALGQKVDDITEGRPVLEEGRDVLEKDALRRKILDVADLGSETR